MDGRLMGQSSSAWKLLSRWRITWLLMGAIRSESYATAAINQRSVRTASGSDRILRATQHRANFTGNCVIRSLPLAVLTRLVATRNYTPRWEKAKLSGGLHLNPHPGPPPKREEDPSIRRNSCSIDRSKAAASHR